MEEEVHRHHHFLCSDHAHCSDNIRKTVNDAKYLIHASNRLRSRNNYLKSKKSAFVTTKKALSCEPAPSQVGQDEVGANIELGETFYEPNSLTMLEVTDSHHNSKSVKEEDFEETRLLSAFNDDGNSKTNKSGSSILTPLLFLGSGESPFPNLGSGVSCGSTYNASCNYNTNRAKLNNTGWRLPCMDPSLLSQV